jgi:tripartite-type tricarboxylate transporter receptor subunit TctC
MLKHLRWLAAFLVFGLVAQAASAQDKAQSAAPSYPSKSVQIIVPFAAGGGTDVVARLVGGELSGKWHQPVVVDNRPGAGGNIGAAVVARSAPDGQTLLATPTGAVVLAPYAFDDVGYPPGGLTAVALLVSLPQILIVPAKSPFKTLSELVAYAKANPGKLNIASSGKGTGQQMAVELLMYMAKISLTDVPYRGSAQANAAALAGEVDLLMTDPSALPQIQSGNLRALGVSTKDPVAFLPGVPAIGEVVQGYEAASYYALFAPSATPRAVQEKINAGVVEALKLPAIAGKLTAAGLMPLSLGTDQSQAFFESENRKWGDLIRAAGIKLK